MTLLPKINRTKYCITDCGNEICDCKPTKILNNNFNKTYIMQTNELRIGNYVNCEDGNIIRINKEDMMCILTQTYEVKPIPLTEEILLKCGFEKELLDSNNPEEGYYYSLRLLDYKYCDLSLLSGDKNGIFEVYLFPYENIRFQYLHQVQNIYYALTSEELEVNL